MRVGVRQALPLAAVVMVACGGGEPEAAGVEVVESRAPFPQAGLSDTADIRIGGLEAGADQQFSRILFAATTSDQQVVVVDAGESVVRWFDSDGAVVARAGRRGEGPGEFMGLASAALLAGDTLVLFDSRTQRLTWLDPSGGLIATAPLQAFSVDGPTLGELDDGTAVVIESRMTPNIGGEEFNHARDTLLIIARAPASERYDTVARLPGSEAVTWVDYVGGQPAGTRQMELPLGTPVRARSVGDGFVVTGAHPGGVLYLDSDGTPLRVARRDDQDPVEISAALRVRYREAELDRLAAEGRSTGATRGALDARLDLLPDGSRLPLHDRILVDDVAAETWARHHRWPWEADDDQSWTVFGADGQVQREVALPVAVELQHVRDRRVTGIVTDELGVESVVVHGVVPGSR